MVIVAVNFMKWQPTEEEMEQAIQKIRNSEEQERIRRFMFAKDKKSAILGRLLVQNMCSWYLSSCDDSGEYKLHRTKEGKPFIEAPEMYAKHPNFNFNISHHGEYVVISSASDDLIGVDVMRVENRKGKDDESFFKYFSDCFTNKEWIAIRNADFSGSHMEFAYPSKPIAEFYTHWTLKEAYVKALGIGLGFPLRDAEFSEIKGMHDGADTRYFSVRIKGKEKRDWGFITQKLDDNHVVSACLGPHNEAIASYLDAIAKYNRNRGQGVPDTPLKEAFASYEDFLRKKDLKSLFTIQKVGCEDVLKGIFK